MHRESRPRFALPFRAPRTVEDAFDGEGQTPAAIPAWCNEGRFKLFGGCGYSRCFRECKSRPATMRAEWVQARYPHGSPFQSAEV